MKNHDLSAAEVSSLYGYYPYRNLIHSLWQRKQGRIVPLEENGGAVLVWGMSVFIGGPFSPANGEQVASLLRELHRPCWIFSPDDAWRGCIAQAFPATLQNKCLRVYRWDPTASAVGGEEDPCIVPVTRDFLEKNLPGTEMLTDELYSYTDMEDYFQHGFGLALVKDGAVAGYCLSEYSTEDSVGVNTWVDERYRGQGCAKKMAAAFLRHCGETKQTAWWACEADNEPSVKTALSVGFVPAGELHYFEQQA